MSYRSLFEELIGQPLKLEGSELRGPCVDCGDPDHRYFNPATGLNRCVKCESSGNSTTYAEACGMDGQAIKILHERHGVSNGQNGQFSPSDKFKPYCPPAGLVPASDAAMREFGRVKGLEIRAIERLAPSMSPDGKILYFPGYDGKGRIVTHIRAAVDGGPVQTNHGPKKYPVASGGKSGVIGYFEAVDRPKVYLFEGLPDTIKALGFDLPAVSPTNGCGQSFKDIAELFKDKEVWIVYDCDTDGIRGARNRATELHGIAASVHIIDLPYPTTPNHGKDFRDFIQDGHSIEEFMQLVENAEWFEPEPKDKTGEGEVATRTRPLTDYGNAERLADVAEGELVFNADSGKWGVYQGGRYDFGVGNCETRAIIVKRVAREQVRGEALNFDSDRRRAWEKHALSLEKTANISNCQREASGLPAFRRTANDFDRNPDLLNVANGTIDLRPAGKLRPHDRRDLMSKIIGISYDPTAESDLWYQFLDDVTGGDADKIEFLQISAGYSATGHTSEEKFFCILGPGGTGKSTFTEGIRTALDEYSHAADFESFIRKSGDGGVRSDLAAMVGKRLVVSIEVDQGKRLAEGLVKGLVSGEGLPVRFLYQDEFELTPQFKLWLAANDAPRIRDDDSGVWRRILRVPFEQVIPQEKRDPRLKAFIKDPNRGGPVVLKWIVDGARKWYESGLRVPRCIVDATDGYRREMDPLLDFIEERIDIHSTAKVSVSELRTEYDRYCSEIGQKFTLSPRDFNSRIEALGARRKSIWWNGITQKCWQGVGLKSLFLGQNQ